VPAGRRQPRCRSAFLSPGAVQAALIAGLLAGYMGLMTEICGFRGIGHLSESAHIPLFAAIFSSKHKPSAERSCCHHQPGCLPRLCIFISKHFSNSRITSVELGAGPTEAFRRQVDFRLPVINPNSDSEVTGR
jgi:hypothetical protein